MFETEQAIARNTQKRLHKEAVLLQRDFLRSVYAEPNKWHTLSFPGDNRMKVAARITIQSGKLVNTVLYLTRDPDESSIGVDVQRNYISVRNLYFFCEGGDNSLLNNGQKQRYTVKGNIDTRSAFIENGYATYLFDLSVELLRSIAAQSETAFSVFVATQNSSINTMCRANGFSQSRMPEADWQLYIN